MHPDIIEGKVKKGGLNNKPKGVRPAPPKGQGTQPTDKQQPHTAICKCAGCRIERPRMDDCMLCVMQLVRKQQ